MTSFSIDSALLLLAQLPPGVERQNISDAFVKTFDGSALESRPPGPAIAQAISAVGADISAFDCKRDGLHGLEQSINALRILLRFREPIPELTAKAVLNTLLTIAVDSTAPALRLCCVRCLINLVFENGQVVSWFWSPGGTGLATVSTILQDQDGGITASTTLQYHTVRMVYMMVSQCPDILATALSPTEAATTELARALAVCLRGASPAAGADADAAKLYCECAKLLHALDLPELAARQPQAAAEVASSVYVTAVAVLAGCGQAAGAGGERGARALACSDASLQLLMRAPAADVFAAVASAGECATVPVEDVAADAGLGVVENVRVRCERALVCVLDRQLTRAAEMARSVEQAAMLTPVLVVLYQLCANSSASRAAIKAAVLPNPWQPSSVSSSNQSSARSAPSPAQAAAVHESGSGRSGADTEGTSVVPAVRGAAMDPTDAPPDSLRGRLLRHMTSLDSQLKRCVAEFLFLLCGEDAAEFTARTGFGNAVALLQIKGLC